MKLIDHDDLAGLDLSEGAERYLSREYPIGTFGHLYDIDGDMSLNTKEFEFVKEELRKKGLL